MSTRARIYEVVRRIPRGRVATYGAVAHEAGLHAGARQVGYALSALGRDADVPWHRVINAKGLISTRPSTPDSETIQRVLLEAEGVAFDSEARIDLDRYAWP